MKKANEFLKKSIHVLFYITITFVIAFKIETAQSAQFQIKNIRVGGAGCPSEKTSVTLSPDSSVASLIFDHFESRVPNIVMGPKTSPFISQINCNIFLEIAIPIGIRLEHIKIQYDMRGFTSLMKEVQGSFRSFLVSKQGLGTEWGQAGPQLITEKNWTQISENQEEDFYIMADKIIPALSQCATTASMNTVTVRLQHTLGTQIINIKNKNLSGSINMDSSDINGGLKISAATSFCQPSTPSPSPFPSPRPNPRLNPRPFR